MKEANPEITAQEIQETLIALKLCTKHNVPNVSSINRHLKVCFQN